MIAVVTLNGGPLASVRIRTAEEGGEVKFIENCTSSQKFNDPAKCTAKEPNPILPEYREVLWGVGSFILLALLMRYFLYPRLEKSMNEREANIQANLDAATSVAGSVAGEQQAYADRIAAAHADAAGIVDAARVKAEAARSAKLATLNSELAQLRSAATAEVDTAKAAAQASFGDVIADVAVKAASKVVAKPLDVSANRNTVDAFVAGGVA
jgi:F-type H+-transporting ATPase subunit b